MFIPDVPIDLPKDSVVLVELKLDLERPLAKLANDLQAFPDDPNWPADGASQHDHYLYGSPKYDDLR